MTLRRMGLVLAFGLSLSLIVGATPSKSVKRSNVAVKTVTDRHVMDQRQVSDAQPITESSAPAPASYLSPEVLDAPLATGASANYEIPWSSVNGGGAPSSSANYAVNASVGQSAIGFATSANYQAGIGYWYGAEAAGGGGCSCPYQCDFDENNQRDAVDLNAEIQILFFNAVDPQDPDCPTTRADFNFDGQSDSVDLNFLIQHLFFNAPPPLDPCA